MEYGRRTEDQLNIRPEPESKLLAGLRAALRAAHQETQNDPHRVYMLSQMRGATHERITAGPVITRYILECAVHSSQRRKRTPLDPAKAFQRLNDHRVPVRENPERPLNPEAYAAARDNLASPRTPLWRVGSMLVEELTEQHSPATIHVIEATMAAANELALARQPTKAA